MAPPKKKNPSNHQPAKDFAKRPKAKVGKRAPAKLNSTDTAFKTSSVAVRSQGSSLDKNAKKEHNDDAKSSLVARMELQSSRGNALSTLQVSLRHHASAVRCSGLRGMRDAVQSLACKGESLIKTQDVQVYNLGISILESNLPSLLPNMCRCWLDEDNDVRDLAIQLFGDILNNLSVLSKDVVTDGGRSVTSHLTCLVPFVPILCAYASSALNSLDRGIRKDGALIVGMMASCVPYPSFSSLNDEDCAYDAGSVALRSEVGQHVGLFLPSFERLLSSMSFGSRTKAKSTSSKRKNDKKRKREGKSSSNPVESEGSTFKILGSADATILSLALLLKASLESERNSTISKTTNTISNNALMPSIRVSGECSFLRGGSAYANSIMLFRETKRQDKDIPAEDSLKPINNSILDLPFIPVDDISRASPYAEGDDRQFVEQSDDSDGTLEKAQVLSTLVETLRIKFVEITQVGRASNTEQKGVMLPASDLDTLDALVKALKFANCRSQFLRDCIVPSLDESKNTTKKREKKSKKSSADAQDMGSCIEAYRSSISKSVSLMLGNFPIWSLDGKSSDRYSLINSEFCLSLAELGGESLGSDESSSLWVDAVFSYILPRLALDEQKLSNFSPDDSDAVGVTDVLLHITQKLLLPISASDSGLVYLLKNDHKRQELLKVFGDAFFPYHLLHGSSRNLVSLTEEGQGLWLKLFAHTRAGRTAAKLLTSLMSWLREDCTNLNEKSSLSILALAQVLPLYLYSWGHNHPVDSGNVLSSMMSITRRWSSTNEESSAPNANWGSALSHLCTGYRSSIGVLFQSPKLKEKQEKGQPQIGSILERSPEPIQKISIGLIGLLGCPNQMVVGSIAKICSRAFTPNITDEVVTPTMASYMFEVMHTLRKSLKVSDYLSFLINASGIEKASPSNDDLANASFGYDYSIQLLCRFLVNSRDQVSAEVLPMIRPTLDKWLTASTGSNISAAKQILRSRAALSILAAFTYDEMNIYHSVSQSALLNLDPNFDQNVIESVFCTIELLAAKDTTKQNHSEQDPKTTTARLLGPVTLILCFREGMLKRYLHEYSKRISALVVDEQKGDASSRLIENGLMKALLLLLRSKEPASVSNLIRRQTDLPELLIPLAEAIEKVSAKSGLEHLSEQLTHEVNHIIRLAPEK